MHYGVRVLHLQHGHVFRVVHMKRMLTTLKAYSLHLHIYDRCGVCARLTWLVVKVSTHTHWHARSRTETHGKALRWRPVQAWLCLPSSPQLAVSRWQPAGVTAGLSLRRPQRLDVSRHARASLIQHEWHLEIILDVIYIIYVTVWFDFTYALRCVFENICVRFGFTLCVDRTVVCLFKLC